MSITAKSRKSISITLCWILIGLSSGCARRIRPLNIAAARGTVDRRPHVLLITIDTLRADHLGCYGYSGVQTPNIDNLARTGVRFTHAYTPVPITLPSHTTIMTGQYPVQTGVRDNGTFRVSGDSTTLAEVFRQQGYRTAAFTSAYVLDSRYGLDQGFEVYDDTLDSKGHMTFLDSERRAEQVTGSALSWISRMAAASPFFVWVHYFDPHASYHPPSPFAEQYAGHLYDGEIAYTDHWIGVLLDHLKSLGLLDNTLVVLTSDHGEGLGEHNEKTHAIFIYDTTLHVPLIMRYPKRIPSNRSIAGLVRTLDIMPTILSLADIPALPSCAGIDLTKVIRGEENTPELSLYCETLYPRINHGWSPLEGIRTGEWKYILAPKPELYNLAEDPAEVNNLWAEQAGKDSSLPWPMRLDELRKQLGSRKSPQGTHLALDQEARERLRSLGYVWTRSQELEESSQHPSPPLPDPKDMVQVQGEIDQAAFWMNDGKYEQAREILVRIAGENPDDLFVRFLLGQVYISLREWDHAREELLQVIAKSPADAGGDSSASAGYADARVYLGIVYLEQGEYEKAVRELTESLQSDADQYQVSYNLGLAYTRLGRLDQALSYLDQALSLKPDQPDIQNNRGVILARQGRIREAIEAYSQAVRMDEKNPRPYQNLAALYQQEGDRARARDVLNQALLHNPDNADLYNYQAYLAIQAGEDEEAWSLLDRGLAIASGHAALHNNRAVLYLKQQQYGQARLELEQAIQSDPNYMEARYNLGRVFEQDWERTKDPGLARKALDCYEQITRTDPNHTQAHLQLAGLRCRLGETDEAISIYRTLLDQDPNNIKVRLNLGIAYGQGGRIDEAIGEYRRILQLDPRNAESCFNLGVAYTQKGDFAKATDACQQAVRLRPDYPEASLNLGVLYWRQGLIDSARKEWEKVLHYDPHNAKAHCNLGNLALSQQDFTKAGEEYRQALQTDPDSVEAHFGLGAACINLGKEADAVREWQETVRLAPDNIQARMNLAVAYINRKNLDLARTMLSQILQLDPGLAAAHQLLEKITELEKDGNSRL